MQTLRPLESNRWCVLYVRPRFEKILALRLQQQNVECYLPVLRRHNGRRAIELPLFPGYLFCNLLRCGRGSTVSWSEGSILEGLSQSEIADDVATLRQITNSDFTYSPWRYSNDGKRVKVMGGPLNGLRGFSTEDNRLVVPILSVLRSAIIDTDRRCRFVSPDHIDQDLCGPNHAA